MAKEEQLPSGTSQWQAGKVPPSLTPYPLQFPVTFCIRKKKATDLNACSRSQSLLYQKPLIQT